MKFHTVYSQFLVLALIEDNQQINEIAWTSMLANWIMRIYSDWVNDRFIHGPAKGPIFLKNSTKNIQDIGIKNNSIFLGIKCIEIINATQKIVKYNDSDK